jgi:hypothetical protein
VDLVSDSSDDRRRAGMSPNNGADPFAPATVDEAIEAARLSSPTAEDDRNAALVRALIQIHALPPGAAATLERVRNQLQSAALADDDDPPMPGDLPRVVRTLPPWRPFRGRFGGWQTSFVREVAAVLVVALLGASFFAALHRGGTSVRNGQPTPGVAHPSGPIGVWQDASISQASTDGQLDFDPTVGVTYAANQDTGDVYACGSGHLWFSHDGGATYTPFMPALPAQAAPTHSARCVITTVPGFPGIFATSDAALQGGKTVPHGTGSIFYAQAGDAGWQTLAIPSTARVINSTPTTPLHADDIWADIFTDFASGAGEPAVGSHNWLFARMRSSYATGIVATPDFGHTWVWLDGPSAAFSCGNFAVDPADPRTVVCDHGNASALSETNNSGYTWQRRDAQPLRDSAVAGVHSDMLYGEQGVNGATHILRRSLATDTWQDVGAAGAAGATAQVALSPAGTLYVLLTDGGATSGSFTVEALAPDAAQITKLLTAALPGHSQDNLRLVGLGPGGVPALYAYDVPLHSPSPGTSLARLLLPSSGIQSGGATPSPTQAALCPNPPPAGVLAGDLADIQPGGIGAPLATFAGRWGPSDGVAAGTTSFGKNGDGANTVGVHADPATRRAVSLDFAVDRYRPMTLDQAKAFVRTVVPTDASDLYLGAPPSGNPLSFGYCSPALAAVFSGENANNTFGRLAAAYYQDAHGVYRITIMPIIFG